MVEQMNIKPRFLDLKQLGKDIAHMSDDEQSEIINGMAEEWKYAMLNDGHKQEMQLCFLSDKLTKEALKWVVNLAEFATMRIKDLEEK